MQFCLWLGEIDRQTVDDSYSVYRSNNSRSSSTMVVVVEAVLLHSTFTGATPKRVSRR